MKVLLEDKNQTVEVPDGLSPQKMEEELRKFYTPEELFGSTTFGEREAYRLKKGRATVDEGKMFYDHMVGIDKSPIENVFERSRKLNEEFTPDNEAKYQAHNWPEKFAGATTELAPYMFDSGVQGAAYGEAFGAAAATVAAGVGMAGPQALFPEEVVTVPAAWAGGRAVGQAYGSWMNASKVEGGGVYKSLLEDGIDPQTARAWAIPAGYLIGAIELLQIEKLIPNFGREGIKQGVKKMIAKGVEKGFIKAAGRFTKSMAETTALETTEEVTQEAIGIAAEVGAGLMEEEGYTGPSLDEAKTRIMDTIKQSLLGFPLLGLPRSIHSTVQLHSKEKFTNIVKTKLAEESLKLDLIDHVSDAAKFDKFEDFHAAISNEIDDAYAQRFGFDNRQLFEEALWNESRDVRSEDKTIAEVVNAPQETADFSQEKKLTGQQEGMKQRALQVAKENGVKITKDGNLVLYHGTKSADAIRQSGVIKSGYLAANKKTAKEFSEGGEVLRVEVPPYAVFDSGAEGDVYFSLNEPIPLKEKISIRDRFTPDVSGITPIQKEIDKIAEREERMASAYAQLEPLNEIYDSLKRSIKKFKGGFLAEELKGIPAIFITTIGGKDAKGNVDEVIERIGNDFGITIKDASDLREFLRHLQKQRQDLQDEIKSNRAQNVTIRDTTLLNKKIKAAEQGIREGRIKTKAEVKAVQQEMIDVIGDLKIDKEAKGDFLKIVTKTITQADLERNLPKLIDRLLKVKEESTKKGLVRDIKRQVQRISAGKSIAVDYVQKIQDFIDQYELKGHTEATIKKLQATKNYIAAQKAAGKNVDMPGYVMEALDILSRTPLDKMSSVDLQDVLAKVKNLADLGKTKLRSRRAVEKMMKARDLAALKADSKAVESRKLKEGNAITGKLTAFERFTNSVKKVLNTAQLKDLVLTPMDAVFDALDGTKNYTGANYRIFKRRIDLAHAAYLDARDSALNRGDKKANDLKLDEDSMERIGLYAAKMQEGGTEKLLSMFTQEQIDAVKLTPNEMKFYEFMRGELDRIRPQIEKVMREVYNMPLGEVKNYFPFLTDFEAMSDKEVRDRFGDKVLTVGQTLKKNVEMGFTKERTGGKNKIRINAAEVFGKHMDNALYLINVGKHTKYLGEIANTEEYGKAVGDVGQEAVREWIDLVARKGQMQGERVRLLDMLRNYTGAVQLGFKISSALVQFTSLMDGASLIGPQVFNGFSKIVTSGDWRKFVMENMGEVRDRIGDDPAFAGFTKKSWNGLNNLAYMPLKTTDKLAASGVALGAYIKYCDENGINLDVNNPDADGIEYAIKMMRRTQSSSHFKDLPLAVTRGKLTGNLSLDKILLQFQSFMLNRWSLIRHDLWRAGIQGSNKKQAIGIATWLIAANFAELGIRGWTREAFANIFGEGLPDDDDEDEKNFFQNLGQILQNIPFVGSLYYSMLYGDVPVPSISMLKKIFSKLSAAVKAGDNSPETKWMKAVLTMIPGGQQFEKFIKNE